MSVPDKVVEAVRAVLHVKARDGKTTKRDATMMVFKKIEHAGGATKFGIGRAAMTMALTYLIEGEVTRQLKMGLTEHEYLHRLPAHTPMEVIAALGKVPRWICVDDKADANWVFSLQASPEHWRHNALLKEKKAQQTQRKANVSMDIARFLMMHKFNSLSEVMTKGKV